MSYRNAARRKHTKGVVLFTVVAIMLFLLIMIMSTLSVVSSAQKRTYTKFKENQAYFTARSGLETVTTSLWNRTYNGSGDEDDPDSYDAANNKFYRMFLQMMYPVDSADPESDLEPKRGPAYIDTNLNQTFEEMDNNGNIAKIKVNFPQPPTDASNNAALKYLYGECTVYIQKTSLTEARIISHATLGDTESTIILYIGPKKEPPDVFDNALTTFGGAGADNMAVFGGISLNINQSESDIPSLPEDLNSLGDPSSWPAGIIGFTNSYTTIQGDQYFNCSMVLDNAKLYPGENGTVIAGDLAFKNNGTILGSGPLSKVFIGGKLSSNTGPTIGSPTEKVNLYCDGFSMGNDNFELYGDLYIYGDDPVTLNGKVHGNVYHLGSGPITVNKAYIDNTLYTNSTDAIAVANEMKIGTVDYGAGVTVAKTDMPEATEPPVEARNKDDVKESLPTLDDISATYEPFDGKGGEFSGWGYAHLTNETERNEDNYMALGPTNLADYYDKKLTEWPGLTGLSMEGGYYVVDATKNDVNYHVTTAYSNFMPNDAKLLIKGKNNVNFYFDEGNYTLGDRAIITNSSILGTSDIKLSTLGANNITLKTNMYFWGNSSLSMSSAVVNAYILAPQSQLNVYTANSNLSGVSSIKYDGISVANDTVLGMGSLVFGKVKCENAPKYFYVRKGSDSPDGKEPGKFWDDMYYFNR